MNYQTWTNKTEVESLARQMDELANSLGEKKQLKKRFRESAVWALQAQSELLRKILAQNTIRLYEIHLPPNIGGSIGDMEQFIVKLDPLE
jgi:hypothetical protein